MIDTLRLTAEDANGLLTRGKVSSQELFDAYRAAIDERDGELHCFLRGCDGEGEGIPIALKDVIGTQGVETTAGSKILAGYVPVYDSTVAARVKSRGLSLETEASRTVHRRRCPGDSPTDLSGRGYGRRKARSPRSR